MKKSELVFNLLSIPFDALAIILAGVVSFYLRYQTNSFVGPVLFELSLSEFLLIMVRVVPVIILIFAALRLYSQTGTRRFLFELNRVVVGLSLAAFLTIILFFFNQSIFPSRFIILAAWAFSIIFVLISRWILKSIQRIFFFKGYGLHRLALINGAGTEAAVIKKVLQNRRYGYEVVAELDNNPELLNQLEKLFEKSRVDEIVQANHTANSDTNLSLVAFARRHGVQFSFVPNLFEVQRNVIELNNLKGIPVISLKNTPLDGWGKATKRGLDILVSSICLGLVSPIFLALAIAIKLDSPGPIIYSAIRVGRDRNFKFYKLRSMFTHLSVGEKYGKDQASELLNQLIKDNEGNRNGPLHKIKDDPRVTRVGKFLRRTKLDEIPQFWNVLIGDMSMVGPRPHLPEQVEQYRKSNGRVLSIKPGIFGYTQIAQSELPTLPFEEEIRLDTYYIENWSLRMDISILFKSFVILFWEKKPKDNY